MDFNQILIIIVNGFAIIGVIATIKLFLPFRKTVQQTDNQYRLELEQEIEEVMRKQNASIRECYVQIGQTQLAVMELVNALTGDQEDDDDTGTRH